MIINHLIKRSLKQLCISMFAAHLCFVCPLYTKAQAKSSDWNIIHRSSAFVPTIIMPASKITVSKSDQKETTQEAISTRVRVVAEDIASNLLLLPEETRLEQAVISSEDVTSDYIFSASHNSIPIRDARMIITVGMINRNIIAVRNSIPIFSSNITVPSVSIETIKTKALNEIGPSAFIVSSSRLVYIEDPLQLKLRLCYELRVRDLSSETWRLTFDATDGSMVERRSLVRHVTGTIKAKVHLHTPFDTLTTVSLPYVNITNGSTTIEADSNGHFQIPAVGSTLTTSLNNSYMGVMNIGGSSATLTTALPIAGQTLLFDESNSDAAERDAFYAANSARTFVRNLDTSLTRLDQFLKINVNVNSNCNAFYDPSNHTLNFFSAGGGCQNTAEISDVVYHEFGHRVQHAVFSTVLGGDSDIVNTSLGEGFSDIYAAFMRDDPRIGVDFYGNNNELLRDCNNKNTWPDSLSIDPHFNGEIVSGSYWDLRKSIGLAEATRLYQRMMHHVPDAPDVFSNDGLLEAYLQTLIATIIADDDDNDLKNGTPHLQQILASFAKHNVTLTGYIQLYVPQIVDQDTGGIQYSIPVTAVYNGPVGSIDTSSLRLYYAVNNTNAFQSVSVTTKGNSLIGFIPSQAAGTTIYYYVSGRLNISNDSIIFPLSPYSFLVGYKRLFFDDCEQLNGWKIGLPTDRATTGLWELAKPYGTYLDPTPPVFFIQQDTDHSPNGSLCYVTGNRNGLPATLTRDPSFDDVDNGATTLTAPIVHLDSVSDPVIRYWYYYSNDQGSNPGVPLWVVKLSVDSGLTWRTIINTSSSTNGWTMQNIHIRQYEPPGHSITLQFIASDYIGALVEAGIDDYEILDIIPGMNQSQVVRSLPTTAFSLPYPNPVIAGQRIHVNNLGGSIELFNMLGTKIASSSDGSLLIPQTTCPGVYLLKGSREGDIFKIVVSQ